MIKQLNKNVLGCYDGKVTIVTGGANGIGEACVRTFFTAGSKVTFCDLKKNESIGLSLESELNNVRLGHAKFIVCDVSNPTDIINLIDTTVKCYGKIDCLINNAGIHPPHYYICCLSKSITLYKENTRKYHKSSKFSRNNGSARSYNILCNKRRCYIIY